MSRQHRAPRRSKSPAPGWPGSLAALGPMFRGPAAVLDGRLPGRWPEPAELDALLDPPAASAAGQRLHFVGAGDDRPSALEYERRILDRGAIALREGHWHDVFNALCWVLLPRARAAINARHVALGAGPRGPIRDALTLLDECGVVIVSSEPELEDRHRARDWRGLFVTERAAWGPRREAVIVGHGLLEQCLRPFIGLTGKALHWVTDPDYFAAPRAERYRRLDRWLAGRIPGLSSPAALLPLPVLGVPGWDPRNQDPAFYDDAQHFRAAPRPEPGA